jgi:urea transport system ATP-binding protein
MVAAAKMDSQSLLQVEGVTVSFDGFLALKELNFSLTRGELRVVIGPNGAGKTTLLDVITGKVRPRSGCVRFQGRNGACPELTHLPEQDIARLGIGRKFQTPNIFKTLSVVDNLRLAVKAPRGVLATLGAAFNRARRQRVDEILDIIGLGAKRHHLAGILAHGEKQWLELGMVMAQDPELLLVDEPVAGMTPRESERTGELLMAMARKHTLIVIDHDMTFVRQIAQTITVLDEGKILCEGTVDDVHNNAKVREVYLGQDREFDTESPRPVGSVR